MRWEKRILLKRELLLKKKRAHSSSNWSLIKNAPNYEHQEWQGEHYNINKAMLFFLWERIYVVKYYLQIKRV